MTNLIREATVDWAVATVLFICAVMFCAAVFVIIDHKGWFKPKR